MVKMLPKMRFLGQGVQKSQPVQTDTGKQCDNIIRIHRR